MDFRICLALSHTKVTLCVLYSGYLGHIEVAETDKYLCPHGADSPGAERDIGSHEMRIIMEVRNVEWQWKIRMR